MARSVNAWLFSANTRQPDAGSMLCTLTALAFRDGVAHFGHVGDIFMLLTDGVWEVIGEAGIGSAFDEGGNMVAIANDLVSRSIKLQKQYLGRNDATAILVRIAD